MFKVARETNEELRSIKADPSEAFKVEAILSIARRYILGKDARFYFCD
jgi:vacuole morphology and inheritance protein 14